MVDFVLGDELIKQVETLAQCNITEPNTQNQLKFDAKGTLHVMHRDMDGKLLKDIPVKSDVELSNDSQERLDECNGIREEIVRQNIKMNVVIIGLAALTILSVLLLNSMV